MTWVVMLCGTLISGNWSSFTKSYERANQKSTFFILNLPNIRNWFIFWKCFNLLLRPTVDIKAFKLVTRYSDWYILDSNEVQAVYTVRTDQLLLEQSLVIVNSTWTGNSNLKQFPEICKINDEVKLAGSA